MQALDRLPGESSFEHHKRLVYGKLVDKTLADVDYSELAPYVYGQEYAPDVARRMMYGSRNTMQLMDAEGISTPDCSEIAEELDKKIVELKIERQKFFDQRNAFNKLVRERARKEEFDDILKYAIEDGKFKTLERGDTCFFDSDNDLICSLSDIHYGASFSNHWGTYDSDVCARRMSEYAQKIIEIGATHHSNNCVVCMNGDLISGSIHKAIQVSNKEDLIQQVVGVSELIAQFLCELSREFGTVFVCSVAGNHSRIEDKDDAMMSERLDDLVEWWLRARLENIDNVNFDLASKIDCSMYKFVLRGKLYVGVHGDYEASLSGVQSLQAMVGSEIYAVLLGHKHHNQTDNIQGVKTLMCGSLMGMDEYCVQKRIYGVPSQMVAVCDENGIRCHYDIELK